jgi:hypothetical protein
MAKNPTGSGNDRLPHPFSDLLAAAPVPPQAEFLVHSVKVVCGRPDKADAPHLLWLLPPARLSATPPQRPTTFLSGAWFP